MLVKDSSDRASATGPRRHLLAAWHSKQRRAIVQMQRPNARGVGKLYDASLKCLVAQPNSLVSNTNFPVGILRACVARLAVVLVVGREQEEVIPWLRSRPP